MAKQCRTMKYKGKVPGKERPYTWREFRELIENIAKEQNIVMTNELDYWCTDFEAQDKPIDDIEWNFVSETDFGGSEGIYTDFVIWRDGKREHLWTAKTLHESDDAYIKMHEFGARVSLAVRHYVAKHQEEFNWRGYDVGYWKDDKRQVCWFCGLQESAIRNADDLKRKYGRAWIRDNKTRKYTEV